MGINRIQFQKGLPMTEFMECYGTEEKCQTALVASHWPSGFICPECGSTRHSTFERKGLRYYWQCSTRREQTTAIYGTIFHATKLPLMRWFLAMHLLGQSKNSASALELKHHLGVRYKTA